ncbi:hypothetical protein BHM03_00017893 [Ensete ventricosum]|nr:hypothetical protein BHM03_00017893 [Ensete ventricosum]
MNPVCGSPATGLSLAAAREEEDKKRRGEGRRKRRRSNKREKRGRIERTLTRPDLAPPSLDDPDPRVTTRRWLEQRKRRSPSSPRLRFYDFLVAFFADGQRRLWPLTSSSNVADVEMKETAFFSASEDLDTSRFGGALPRRFRSRSKCICKSGQRVGLPQYLYSLKGVREVRGQGRRGSDTQKDKRQSEWRWIGGVSQCRRGRSTDREERDVDARYRIVVPWAWQRHVLVVKGAEEVENAEANSKYHDKVEGQRLRNFIRPISVGCCSSI